MNVGHDCELLNRCAPSFRKLLMQHCASVQHICSYVVARCKRVAQCPCNHRGQMSNVSLLKSQMLSRAQLERQLRINIGHDCGLLHRGAPCLCKLQAVDARHSCFQRICFNSGICCRQAGRGTIMEASPFQFLENQRACRLNSSCA